MLKDIYILPENTKTKKANGVTSLLRSQGGYSLAEVLVVAIVMAVMIITIYRYNLCRQTNYQKLPT